MICYRTHYRPAAVGSTSAGLQWIAMSVHPNPQPKHLREVLDQVNLGVGNPSKG